ncbi:histone-lysine N-methyltransferase SETMAR [Trichonephila clavipes]|nr:histone-lysine N-methyltransferase SETMAR [Trichonephila clavipes]
MVIVTYDIRRVIVYHFIPHGRTVTAQYYRDFLVRQVRPGVHNKRPDLVEHAIILLDNARSHKAECVWQVTRFTYGAENVDVDVIQRPQHRRPCLVTVAGDYIEVI